MAKMRKVAELFILLVILTSAAACKPLPPALPTLDSRFSRFHIIYLADESTQGILSPGAIAQSLGARVVFSWSELMGAATADYVSAIMIHRDAADQVEVYDLITFYDRGVTLVFLDVWTPQIGDLVRDRTISSDHWMDGSEPMEGDFYIIIWHQITCTKGGIAQGRPWRCPEGTVISGGGNSRAAETVATGEDYLMFQDVLFLELQTDY